MATISGTTGNDVISGTTLDDVISGGAGDDRINGGAGNDTIYGGIGKDTLTGDAGNDLIYGGDGNDGFFGGGGNDTAYGEAGDDAMFGDGGDDVLYGGDGNDALNGGIGNDTLYGGTGVDSLVGGSGADTFVIELASTAVTAAVRADLATLKAFMDGELASAGSATALSSQTTSNTLTLPALGLTISGIETVKIFIDNVLTPISSLINTAPVASGTSSFATNEDQAFNGQIVASDPDGDALGYTVAQGPAHGTLSLNAATGAYTYTPGANYNGSDSFKVVVADPSGATAVQTVSVGVTSVNDAPVTGADSAISGNEDTTISGQVVATDVDGDVLGYAVSTGPAHGTLTLDANTGAYVYTPGANFNGSDSFKVAVADPSGATAIQTVTVGVNAVNDAPATDAASSITTNEDISISGQVVASDVDGDILGYAISTGPTHGTLTLDANTGAYVYTPGANFNGSDSFKVAVADPSGATAIQTVTVGVTGVNDAPVTSAASSIATNEDTAISGQVIASDVEGDVLGYAISTGPAHGTLTLNATTGAYTYTPGANYNGSDSFKVVVADPSGATAVQTVTVGVNAVNDAPVTNATGALSTAEDKSISGAIVATDVDFDVLGYSVSTGPAHGTLTLNAATGAYTYTPAANFAGNDTFDVTVSDPSGATSLQRVSVSVSAVADQPTLAVVNPVIVPAGVVLAGLSTNDTLSGTAGSDTISGNAGNDVLNGSGTTTITVGLDIASQLTDLDGSETLSIKISNLPAGGVLSAGTANGDGTWSLSPADLAGLKVTATVTGGFTVHVEATATETTGAKAVAAADIDVILSPDANVIFGGGGDDRIVGGSGDDTLYGGTGNDTIFGNGGNDAIYGGKGNDIISGGDGDNKLYGDSNDDTFFADAGNDLIYGGSGFDTVDYSAATSAITVDISKKSIIGVSTGNDVVSGIEKVIGTAFADTFKGSSANDIIMGGGGNDWMRGIAGDDTLTGGIGNDTYFWEKIDVVDSKGKSLGIDQINDFGGGDILDLTKLVSIGTKPLSDFVKVTDGKTGSTVSANINGTFEDVVVLDGVHGKTALDLLHEGHLLIG